MAAFKDINWHNLLDMEAPFIPQPEDVTDTSYFEGIVGIYKSGPSCSKYYLLKEVSSQ